MASYVPPVFHATNDVWAVTDANGFAGDIQFLWQRPYFNYYGSVATSIPNNANTQVTLGGSTVAGYGFSISSNNVIIPLTGIYQVSISVSFATASSSQYQGKCYHNGSEAFEGGSAATANVPVSTGSGIVSCSAGDTLALYAFQNSGSPVNTSTGANVTYISGFLIGSQ